MALNLAIIGCGKIFQEYHLQSILKQPELVIKMVVDKNIAVANKVAKITGAVPLTDAGDIQGCQVCFIATPPSSRLVVFEQIKSKGMHLVFEKPLAFNLATANYIINETESVGRNIFVTQTRRFFPNIQFIRRLLQSKILTPPFQISVYEGGIFNWVTESNYLKETNREDHGIIHDIGSHIYDYLLLFVNDINKSKLDYKILYSSVDFETLANNHKCMLDFGDEVGTAEISLSRNNLLMNKLVVKDSRNVIVITDSAFSREVIIKKDSFSFNISVSSDEFRSVNLDMTFDNIWENIVSKCIINKFQSDLEVISGDTVLPHIKLIQGLIDCREVETYNNFFKTFGYEY